MSEGGFEEMTKEKREAMANCSKAILETIQSYGFSAALDIAVRISNHDDIVSAMLPYFPTIARAAMMGAWTKRTDTKVAEGNPEVPPLKVDPAPRKRVRRTKKGQKLN